MMLIPYRLTINAEHRPIVNSFIIGITATFFVLSMFVEPENEVFETMVLRDWNPAGMLGSLFLHADMLHLIGNMIFLWVFGNAICSTTGNALYPAIYFFLGLCASAMHLIFSSAPAIGASGAINGIVGMAFVLFPLNKLDVAYAIPFIGLVKFGKITLKSYWMIALWVVLDILGILIGGGNVAYWAHIGGFVGGMALAASLISLKRIRLFDPTLLDVVRGKAEESDLVAKVDLDTRVAEVNAQAMLTPGKTIRKRDVTSSQGIDAHALWTGESVNEIPTVQADPPVRERPAVPPPASRPVPAQTPSTPSMLTLRLLRVMRTAEQWTCYFVNDGGDVSDLRVEGSAGFSAEIHPQTVLKKKEPGWLKLTWNIPASAAPIGLDITYDNQAGGRGTQRLLIPAADNRPSPH